MKTKSNVIDGELPLAHPMESKIPVSHHITTVTDQGTAPAPAPKKVRKKAK